MPPCSRIVCTLGLTLLTVSCDDAVPTPSSPTPVVSVLPIPTVPRPSATNVLSGVIVEVTASEPIPVEGATVYLMTCGTVNCPDVIGHTVQSDKNGAYRMERVYDGELNFLWVEKDNYDLANPMRPGSCPDGCDRLVKVIGDTTLNIELVRR
jgi:hypothetical protein